MLKVREAHHDPDEGADVVELCQARLRIADGAQLRVQLKGGRGKSGGQGE